MSGPPRIDFTGRRIGRLTAIRDVGNDKYNYRLWECQCDCGRIVTVSTNCLSKGKPRSCGCLRKEVARESLRKRSFRHGYSGTRLYGVWVGMVRRTEDPKSNSYKYYGGRGIAVCPEWRESFAAFYDWAIANGYDETALRGQCTIDRIDNDKGYSPDNCRWVNMAVQNTNKRNTRSTNNTIGG